MHSQCPKNSSFALLVPTPSSSLFAGRAIIKRSPSLYRLSVITAAQTASSALNVTLGEDKVGGTRKEEGNRRRDG